MENKNSASQISGELKQSRKDENSNSSSESGNKQSGQIENLKGNLRQVSNQENTTLTSQNQNEIKTMILNRHQEMVLESLNNFQDNLPQFKTQNSVRIAVQTLLMAGDVDGGIGNNISQIAKEFNNSAMSQYRNEEKIQTGNSIAKMLFGGDSEAVGEILKNNEENRLRIEELNRLISECNCDKELKMMFKEQVQALQNEQNRLNQTASEKRSNKGFFGFLFGN